MPGLSSVACLCRGVCLRLSPLQTPGAAGEGEDGPCGPDKHPGTLLQYFESASARCCTLCCAICTTQQKAKAENNQGGHGHLGLSLSEWHFLFPISTYFLVHKLPQNHFCLKSSQKGSTGLDWSEKLGWHLVLNRILMTIPLTKKTQQTFTL